MNGPWFVVAAAAAAFGLAIFLAAKAPDVETARIARPTRMLFIVQLPGE
jgi:hypothetical protein